MTAQDIAQAWSETFQQHNLLSTATLEQRNAFIKRNIDAYNRIAAPLLQAADATPQAPARHSSVDTLEFTTHCSSGTRQEAAALVLSSAAFHLDRSQPYELADAAAIDVLDTARQRVNPDPNVYDEDADGHITRGEIATGTE